MRVQISDWQHKSEMLRAALVTAGHEIVKARPDILLVDFDGPVAHYPKTIEKAYSEGALIAMYSHGAMPLHGWDGIWEPNERVSVHLVMTPGQQEVMRRYGYPIRTEVIGWHYCEQRKFEPIEDVWSKRVLFAPWHPHGNGWMLGEARALNTKVYSLLRDMPVALTVRHVRTLFQNGLEEAVGVEYQPSDMTLESAVKAIDAADLVVSHGTFAYLAVARGKPVVFYGQNIRPHDGYSDEMLRYALKWDLYRDYMRYPYDISDTKPKATWNILQQAGKVEASEWRSKFIGYEFDPVGFVKLLERLKGEE